MDFNHLRTSFDKTTMNVHKRKIFNIFLILNILGFSFNVWVRFKNAMKGLHKPIEEFPRGT
jgi:hypothetical protein